MAGRDLDFRILGPLEVRVDGEPIALGGPKQRAFLALLLLNSNRVVSRARLIAELQEAPADADRVVRVQASRLRTALESGGADAARLITRSPGYWLRVEEGELDLHRFQALVAFGRNALDRGAYEPAVAAFEEAELLWRGDALEGLRSAPFASGEAARLDEARRAAIEERIEAELALGRRRRLEPTILRQDDALELVSPAPMAPADTPVAAADNRDARGRRWITGTAALAATLVVALAVVALLDGGSGASRPVEGNALAKLSSRDGQPIAGAALDAAPTRIASGSGSLWVTHVDAGTISRVDPVSRTLRGTITVGEGPFGIAVAADDVWVANSADGTVSRVDPSTNTVVQTIAAGSLPSAVAASGRAVFVANRGDETLVRIDAVTGAVTAVIDTGSEPSDVAVSGDTLWVSNQGDGTVSRIDAPSGARVQTIRVGNGPSGLAVTRQGVWVVNSLDATVSRIDPQRGVVTATIPVGARPGGISASAGSIWVSDSETGRLLQIDERRGVTESSVAVGEHAGPILDTRAGQWIGVASGGARHAGGTLTIASTMQDVRSLDPAVLDDLSPSALLGLTNDGLVTLNHVGGPEGMQLVPDLAVALPSATDDGREYTFRLRRGLRFSTGAAVGPRDVRRSLERLFELRSSGRSLYDRIIGARRCLRSRRCDLSHGIAVDDRDNSVTFRLVASDPDFLHKLTSSYAFVLPASTPSRRARSPLPATGPYVISAYEPGREIRLTRNPRFRVWSAAAQPAGYPDEILWRLGQRPAAATAAVIRGQADLMMNNGGPPAALAEELRTRSPGQLHSNPVMGTDFFFLNTRARPFDDVRVRRAVNYALDRNRTVAIHGGPESATPTCQVLPPRMPGFRRYCPYTRGSQGDGRWRGPDLAKAQWLVDTSGTRGMRVTVWSTPTPTVAREQGRYLTALLRRLGYRASLRLLPDAEFLRYTDDSRSRAQVVSGGWGADYPSPSSFIGKLTCRALHPNSESTFNTSQFCDPGIDRRVARAERLQLTSRARSLDAWSRLDRELTDLAIWLPTVTGTQTDIVSKRVGNYRFHPFWGVLVDQLWVR